MWVHVLISEIIKDIINYKKYVSIKNALSMAHYRN